MATTDVVNGVAMSSAVMHELLICLHIGWFLHKNNFDFD